MAALGVLAINVRTQAGRDLPIQVTSPATTIGAFKFLLEQQYHDQYPDSVPVAANQNLIFAGKRLQDDQTLEFYQIANGATLHLVVLNLTGDIGEWLEPSEADRRILFDAGSALATPPSEVAAIVRAAAGPSPPLYAKPIGGKAFEEGTLLNKSSCKQLVERIERHLAADDSPDALRDMKFVVAEGELAKLIGSEAVAALRSMGEAQLKALGADAASRATFKLRRREAIAGTQDDVIPFHRDSSLVVVNVALNDDFDGAALLFAVGDKIVRPARKIGTATAHDCRIHHAVTRLAAGVRYNLYATYERPVPAAA